METLFFCPVSFFGWRMLNFRILVEKSPTVTVLMCCVFLSLVPTYFFSTQALTLLFIRHPTKKQWLSELLFRRRFIFSQDMQDFVFFFMWWQRSKRPDPISTELLKLVRLTRLTIRLSTSKLSTKSRKIRDWLYFSTFFIAFCEGKKVPKVTSHKFNLRTSYTFFEYISETEQKCTFFRKKCDNLIQILKHRQVAAGTSHRRLWLFESCVLFARMSWTLFAKFCDWSDWHFFDERGATLAYIFLSASIGAMVWCINCHRMLSSPLLLGCFK